jgi:hypothetical protein
MGTVWKDGGILAVVIVIIVIVVTLFSNPANGYFRGVAFRASSR